MGTKIFRKFMGSILIGLMLCDLTGCMLLPKEEEEHKVSYIKADVLDQYILISPQRVDIEKRTDISCIYKSVREENLSFKEDGQVVEEVYVNEGDRVKKGTLLANLRLADMEDEIKGIEDSITQTKQAINQLKLEASIEKENVEVDYKYNKISEKEKKQKISEIEYNLKSELEGKEDDIYIQNLRLKEKKEIVEGSKIYAPMDGVISYIEEELKDSLSKKDITVIKMIDSEKCAFEIYLSEQAATLKEGQTYTVDCEVGSFNGTILPYDKEKSSYIYLQIKNPPRNLSIGLSGIIHYAEDSRKNVLALPSNIVHKGEGYNFVYVINKDNIKVIQKVEVGLTTEKYAEIMSGLKEDDLVVNE